MRDAGGEVADDCAPVVGDQSGGFVAAISPAQVTHAVHAAAKIAAAITKPAVVTQLTGDFNHNGVLDIGDVIIFERALADLATYQNNNQLSDSQLLRWRT